MVDYFDTAQMSSALASLTARVTGKAGEVSLYPVLKKATSSNEQPTPGYIYQVIPHLLMLLIFHIFGCFRKIPHTGDKAFLDQCG